MSWNNVIPWWVLAMDPEKEFRCVWCQTTKPLADRVLCKNNEDPDTFKPEWDGQFPHCQSICTNCSIDQEHCRYCVPKEKT